MAWTTPGTAVSGATFTSANYNAWVRDNLAALNPLDSVGATSWSPNLEASTTNPNNGQITPTGRYWRAGPVVYAEVLFAFDAGFSNPSGDQGSGTYFVTLPISASGLSSSANGFGGQTLGSFSARDDSSTANSRAGSVQLASSTTIRFNIAGGGAVTESAPFSWAANDVLSLSIFYFAA